MWEEPCISGEKGSGAVFFSGCPLHCVYCQNHNIAAAQVGREISLERLSTIFLELQAQGAANINLVTPTHYTPQIICAVEDARRQGLHLPIVYNCSGYEKVDTLRQLEGIVDIYLTDFKYMDGKTAAKYSHAPDYPEVAKAALAEMVRQIFGTTYYPSDEPVGVDDCIPMQQISRTPSDSFKKAVGAADRVPMECMQTVVRDAGIFDQDGMMQRGIIVRHLLLPGRVHEAQAVVRYVYETYGDAVWLSLMNQYTPMPGVADRFPELGRKVTQREYDSLVDYAIDLGVEHAFIQEGPTAEESFIPDFNYEGL